MPAPDVATRSSSSTRSPYHLLYRWVLATRARLVNMAPFDRSVMWYRCIGAQRYSRMQKWRMKSSIEERKFRNPASTFDLASSAERAHRARDGSMQTKTYATGP